MANDLLETDNPSSGGNPWVDAILKANPDALAKMGEAVFMPAEKAYKHLFGEDLPMLRKTEVQEFIKNHGEAQGMLLKHALTNLASPTYGATLGAGAQAMGMTPEAFATPEQRKVKLTPDTSFIGPMPPVQTDIGKEYVDLQAKGLIPPESPAGREISGRMEPLFTEGPRVRPEVYVDPNTKLNTIQRSQLEARMQRESRWPRAGYMSGPKDIALAEAAARSRGLEPGTPEWDDYMGDFLEAGHLYKRGVQKGTPEEELIRNRARKAGAQAGREEFALTHDEEKFDLLRRDVESRILARTKSVERSRLLSQSLIDLRNSETELNQMRAEGTLPEHVLRQAHEFNMEKQRRFVRSYLSTWDPKDLLTPEGQDAAAQELMEILGLSHEAAVGHVSLFRRLYQSIPGFEAPNVTRTQPPVPGESKPAPVVKPTPNIKPPVEPEKPDKKKSQKTAPELLNDLAELEEAAKGAAGKEPGAQYRTRSGNVYTWDGKGFNK